MPFTITIEKPTGEEAIAELIRVAQFYERFEAAGEAPAPSPRKPRAKKDEQPAEQASAAAPEPTPAPEPALDGEALRVKIRGLLTPLMKGDKAGAARGLVRRFGDSITVIPEDKLPELLAEAEAL